MVEEVVSGVVGVSGAMVVVGNVVNEAGSSRVVGVLMTVNGDIVEEVVLGADVMVVVEGLRDDGSLLLLVVVVVVVGGTVEGIVDVESSVVVLPKVVVVGLGVVVDTNVLDEGMVVVVSDGTSVVDDAIVVVGQCW